MRIAFLLLAVSLSISVPRLLFAQPREQAASDGMDRQLEAARAAFLEGMQELKAGRWAQAERLFRRASLARSTPGLLYYTAYCLEQQGQFKGAYLIYAEAKDLARQQPAPDVERLLPGALDRTRAELAQITFDVMPVDATVLIDGQVANLDGKLLVEPGPRRILVRAPLHEDWSDEVTLKRGQEHEVIARLKPQPRAQLESQSSPPPQVEAQASKQSRRKRTAKPFLVAGGALLAVGGATFGVLSTVRYGNESKLYKEHELEIDKLSMQPESACVQAEGELKTRCSALQRASNDQRQARTMMIVGYSTAAVGVLTAGLVHFLYPSVPVELSIHPSGAWLGVSGHF